MGQSMAKLAVQSIHLNLQQLIVRLCLVLIIYIQMESHHQDIQQEQGRSIRYAKLLVQSYRERPNAQKEMSLDQYLTEYAQTIGQPPSVVFSKKQEQTMVTRYIELKQQLQQLIVEKSAWLQKQKGYVLPAYDSVKDLIAKRQLTTLQSISHQLEDIDQTDEEEQLGRIKKVIANGAWGCLERLHERLAKLRELQNDS